MKIKHYKCKCGENDFFFDDKGNQTGIYCSYCGKWLKWADKDEQNLVMKQESFINKPCVSSGVCEHDKSKVLEQIRAEIEQNAYPIVHGVNNHEKGMTLYGILQIIDKYKESGAEE